ncbi:prostaglandin f synthase [Angomonas deanei]|nr:prostaglandin f synthase [Angomonas deanei]|eukprot:EPY14988.1 prostaglandin f synthase [Angomonas deanei]
MTCPSIVLHNGVKMPQVGLGMWKTESGDVAVNSLQWAVEAGYRHIDTAAAYGNESSVGQGLKGVKVPREEIFVTTKLWNADHGYDKALEAFEKSRAALGVDYVDLYLIHWPGPNKQSYLDSWRALEKLYEEKKVRAIGLSNFNQHHIEDILAVCKVRPMVNQIEVHPQNTQAPLRQYCKEQNIAVTGWSPLGQGNLLQHPVLVKIAEKHKRTTAQVIIRWFIQSGMIVIPKSVNKDRIASNFDVFNFTLDEEDLKQFESVNENKRSSGDPEVFFDL